MFDLERISDASIPSALEKAERYRLLNEPLLAESICLDVLEVSPRHQKAIVTLVLALSDQFTSGNPANLGLARDMLKDLDSEYERVYYAGLLAERRATALMEQGGGQRGCIAYDLFREAMDLFKRAREIAPEGVDDPILRWNTCARLIMRHSHVRPAPDEPMSNMLE